MLDEMAAAARETVHEGHFERIGGLLTTAARQKIDELLAVAPGQSYSGYRLRHLDRQLLAVNGLCEL